jgi:quercetin dioxygenase-like cupin family protein
MSRVSSLKPAGLFLCACALASLAHAQPAPPAGSRILRAVLASAPLPSVVDAPRYLRVWRVSLPARQLAEYRGAVGFVFTLSGSVELIGGLERQVLDPGEGLAVQADRSTTFRALGAEPAVFLHFALLKESELGQAVEGGAASASELYRTASAIPGLKPGPYEFTLVRVTFPAREPSNPPHHRSGAALYYVLAGSGVMTLEGRTESRAAGVVQYEPTTLVHSWGNPGDAPLVLIQANISQEGVPVVIFEKAPVAGK